MTTQAEVTKTSPTIQTPFAEKKINLFVVLILALMVIGVPFLFTQDHSVSSSQRSLSAMSARTKGWRMFTLPKKRPK